MDLYTVQYIFYVLGILFMMALIGLVGTLIFVLFEIKNTVDRAVTTARETVIDLRDNTISSVSEMLTDNRSKIAGTIGMTLLPIVVRFLTGMFSKKKKA
jgi:hypothetical protein